MAGEMNQNELFKRLLAEQGLQKAFTEHAEDTTTYGNPQLPKGIERGVARLKEVKLGVYETGENKGKLYFMAQGIVKSPENFKGVNIAGLHTKIGPEPLCDTPKSTGKFKTASDHFGRVLNWLRGLGVETKGKQLKDLPVIFATLNKIRPHFYFRTWAGPEETLEQRGNMWCVLRDGKVYRQYPTKAAAELMHKGLGKEPMIQHEWNGVAKIEKKEGDGITSAVNDESPTPDQVQTGDTEASYPPDETTPDVDPDANTDNGEDAYSAYSDQGDIDELAKLAEEGNEQASTTLQDYARSYGVTDDQLNEATDHFAIAELVKQTEGWNNGANKAEETTSEPEESTDSPGEDTAQEGEESSPEPEPEIPTTPVPAVKPNPKVTNNPKATTPKPTAGGKDVAPATSGKPAAKPITTPAVVAAKNPEKGKVRKYTIPATSTAAAREIEGEVVFVDEGKKVVNLKNLEDNKVLRGIPWNHLK